MLRPTRRAMLRHGSNAYADYNSPDASYSSAYLARRYPDLQRRLVTLEYDVVDSH